RPVTRRVRMNESYWWKPRQGSAGPCLSEPRHRLKIWSLPSIFFARSCLRPQLQVRKGDGFTRIVVAFCSFFRQLNEWIFGTCRAMRNLCALGARELFHSFSPRQERNCLAPGISTKESMAPLHFSPEVFRSWITQRCNSSFPKRLHPRSLDPPLSQVGRKPLR